MPAAAAVMSARWQERSGACGRPVVIVLVVVVVATAEEQQLSSKAARVVQVVVACFKCVATCLSAARESREAAARRLSMAERVSLRNWSCDLMLPRRRKVLSARDSKCFYLETLLLHW